MKHGQLLQEINNLKKIKIRYNGLKTLGINKVIHIESMTGGSQGHAYDSQGNVFGTASGNESAIISMLHNIQVKQDKRYEEVLHWITYFQVAQ